MNFFQVAIKNLVRSKDNNLEAFYPRNTLMDDLRRLIIKENIFLSEIVSRIEFQYAYRIMINFSAFISGAYKEIQMKYSSIFSMLSIFIPFACNETAVLRF